MSSNTYVADEYAAISARMRELKGEVVAVAGDDIAGDDYWCPECEGGGWVMSAYQAAHAPNLEECPLCMNPLGQRCP